MKKSDIRKAFKDIGYKCSLRSHELILDGLSLSFISDCGYTNSGGTVSPEAVYNKHKAAFELCQKFNGQVLESGERVIV